MTYPYGMRNAPSVGNGLGGLPRRAEAGVSKAPGDPLWGNVSLLLHADGNLLDSGPLGIATVAVGNAAVSSADRRFGSGSIYFDGNGDFVQFSPLPNINVLDGDFTIECFVKRTGYTDRHDCIFTLSTTREWNQSPAGPMVGLGLTCGSLLTLANLTDYTAEIPLNVWVHFACARNGSALTVYFNGYPVASVTQSAVLGNATAVPGIGTLDYYPAVNRRFFTGYIDEFRITKGVARYIGPFTPPIKAFPSY